MAPPPTFPNLESFANSASADWSVAAGGVKTVPNGHFGSARSLWLKQQIQKLCEWQAIEFDVLALGDFALEEIMPGQVAEVALFCRSGADPLRIEEQVEKWSTSLLELCRTGCRLCIQIRPWNVSQTTRAFCSDDSFDLYQIASMSLLDRLELGACSMVFGRRSVYERLIESVHGSALESQEIDWLLAQRRELESRLVSPKHARRDIRHGVGGLSDVEWLVRLLEFRFPRASSRYEGTLRDRIHQLAQNGHFNAFESSLLIAACEWFDQLRELICRFEFTPDVLPENPDRLDRMAEIMNCTDGNALLRAHEERTESIRAVYNEGVERLRP